MARYDDDTSKFMHDVATNTKFVAKQVVRGTPLPKAIARQAIAGTTFAALEKQGSMKVMDVFKLLNSHYEHDWWDWEPETLWQTIKMDHDIEATEDVKNIIQALQVVVKTDAPFEHWNVFEKIGHAFCSNQINFAEVQPLEIDDIAITCVILRKIRPKAVFEQEVIGYIAACAKESGACILDTPPFPEGAQAALNALGNNEELVARVKAGGEGEDVTVQRNKLKTIANRLLENAL